MSGEANERGISSLSNQAGLSIVCSRDARFGPSSKVVQCKVCAQQTEYTDNHAQCHACEAGLSLNIADSHYSGYEPTLVPTCHEVYMLKPAVRTVDERRYPRITCRNVRACINTEANAGVIVDLINISRGGVCFSSYAEFHPGTPVSIATHYIVGGQNIFQNGRIVRMQRSPSATAPGEYAIEFSPNNGGMGVTIPGTLAGEHHATFMLLVGPTRLQHP
jgi:hypothetical protein